MKTTIQGLYTALITPFTKGDKLDEKGLKLLLQRQIEAKVDGITLLGTTSESPTLTDNEPAKILSIARSMIPKQIEMMVGVGSNSTQHTIDNIKKAEKAGADSLLAVVPYYNKPSQEGLYIHFKAIAAATKLPILLYNVPGRCGQNLAPQTVQRLFPIKNIVGIKEASGNISQIIELIAAAREHRPGYAVLSGDDGLTLPLMAAGGDGLISVLSNLLPKEMKAYVASLEKGDYVQARDLHYKLQPLFVAEFIEGNPTPIKTAMTLSGLPAGPCRPPLGPLTAASEKILKDALRKLK